MNTNDSDRTPNLRFTFSRGGQFSWTAPMRMTAVMIALALLAEATAEPPLLQSGDDAGSLQHSGSTVVPTSESLDVAREHGAQLSMLKKNRVDTNAQETPQPRLEQFRASVQPVLRAACHACHAADNQEGNFRVDTLDPDLSHGQDIDWWLEVLNVLSNGEMPPEDADELSDEDRSAAIEWLAGEVQTAAAVRIDEQNHSAFRRLARYEYNYALQDLLGLSLDFAQDLPPEAASSDGFQNSSSLLQMSSRQFASYRQLARNALELATVRGSQPARLFWQISMRQAAERQAEIGDRSRQQQKRELTEKQIKERDRKAAKFSARPSGTHYLDTSTGMATKASWSYRGARYAIAPKSVASSVPPPGEQVAILPVGQRLIVELGNRIADRGVMRVRVRACRTTPTDPSIPSLALEFGFQASNNSAASVLIGDLLAIEAAPEKPQFYQWEIPLSQIAQRNPLRQTATMGKTPNPSEFLKLMNLGPGDAAIRLDYIEVEAPVYDDWPPASHRRLFPERETVVSDRQYARQILTRFMPLAWRRDVSDEEIQQKLKLFDRLLPVAHDFQDAMLEVVSGVLASPNFLYLTQSLPSTDTRPGARDEPDASTSVKNWLSDFELATRLSMFLWCSVPDDELLRLAREGKLRQPAVLDRQVKRLLADQRSARFCEQFVRQWLGLELLDYLKVDKEQFPEFNDQLRLAMTAEPIAYFEEILKHDSSVIDFLHSDYALVNERLARHYGLEEIYGREFRRVELTSGSHRGGLLTMAGLLAMNSDGVDSHPLKRGIWLLERILNDPPPPAPPAVPEIDLADPEIAKLTLKERIEDHRNDPACISCHIKIDPWGIAFENFDAVGRWRDKIKGKRVDASSLLFNQQRLDGTQGLKRFLLTHRQDQFVRALTHKLVTFGLGRPLTFTDRLGIERIAAEARQQGDGLSTLIRIIAGSELFHAR